MRALRIAVLVVLLAPAARAQDAPPAAEKPPELGFEPSPDDRPHLGGIGFLGTKAVKLADGTDATGAVLAGAKPGSGLEKAGVKANDVLLGLGDWTIPAGTDDVLGAFRDRLNTLPPDSETDVLVWREGAGASKVRVKLGRQPPSFARMDTPGTWFTAHYGGADVRGWMAQAFPLDDGLSRYGSVISRQRKHSALRDPLRLEWVTVAHLNLAAQGEIAEQLTGRLPAVATEVAALAAGGAKVPDRDPSWNLRKLDAVVDRAASDLASIEKSRGAAFSSWTDEDRAFFAAQFSQLTERLKLSPYLYDDEKPARERINRRLVALLAKVDRVQLSDAAAKADSLETNVSVALRDLYVNALERGTLPAGLLASRETPQGRIEIWGSGDQRHTARCALCVDLSGEDQYLDCAARADAAVPVSIFIDLDGDDLWQGTSDFGCAGALCGIALLLDKAGNDTYAARDWSLGAAAAGFASLIDSAGDDRYAAQEFSQGAGLCGGGVLDDVRGDDFYSAARFCQGVGLPGGAGALLDEDGDDRYVCTGRYESEYGEPGLFSGWGQGVGFGFRGVASGGIGMLYDLAGADVYEAGNFSQACGYFYGWGILRDDGGDDRYSGSRYAQGSAAHQAVATFLEGRGDDVYRSVADVAQGLAWDESSVYFRDHAGNDRYTSGGFSLASAAHNGMVVFIDDAGDDAYAALPAHAAQNTYHGGKSFALFLDLAGADTYAAEKPEDANLRSAVREDGAYCIDTAEDEQDWKKRLR